MDDERELIEALKRGEPQALDAFYRAYARTVLAWAIRLGGPSTDAEDIAQDVFAVAFRKIETFRGESRLSTWLFSITRNVLHNARRKAAVRKLVTLDRLEEIPSGRPSSLDHVQRMQDRARVQAALQKLKRSQREVLVLMDLEGRSAPDVAEMLNIPAGTVYSRLHYSRKAFAKVLTRMDTPRPVNGLLAGGKG